MKSALFYFATVAIWGSTWIGIKMQLGVVEPMVSVGYRFALAALLLFCWCLFQRLPMRFSMKDHTLIAMQGTFLFAVNYLLFYLAEQNITSGLAAVLFSTILLMNIINQRIFLGTPVSLQVLAGGVLGLTGIVMVFEPEIDAVSLQDDSVQGILLCLAATACASLGNILSAANQRRRLPVVQSNGYGMAYGAVLMLGLALFSGKEFSIDPSLPYLASLGYLALFGSVIAFGCYLTLVGTIGPDRAAYATLLFPIVALIISTIWEGYQWSGPALAGVALILVGNLLMLKRGSGGIMKVFPIKRLKCATLEQHR